MNACSNDGGDSPERSDDVYYFGSFEVVSSAALRAEMGAEAVAAKSPEEYRRWFDDDDPEPPTECSVCAGPPPLSGRSIATDPSRDPKLAIASLWFLCPDCLVAIATADRQAVVARMRPEDQTADYVDLLADTLIEHF